MRKYKSVDFQFDPEIERTARRLRREHRELQVAVAMDDLQDLRNLNRREGIQPVNVHEGLNGQFVQRQPGNNNIIHKANDRDRAIRDYAVLIPQAIHPGIVRPDIQADNFELKPVMFQMLQTVGQFNGLPSEDPYLHLKLFLELETFYNGLNPSTKLMVDASANGTLLSKSYNEVYEILERIANNNYQWPSTRQAAARGTVGVHNVDTLTALSAQVTSLTRMVKAMTTAPVTVNQISDVSCVYCGEGHLFDNCPGNLTSINYVGSFNRQNQDNPYSNNYNSGWRHHPNFSWSYQNQTTAAPSGQNRPAQPPGFYQQNQEQRSINNDQLSSIEGLIKDYIVKNEAVVQSHAAYLRNLENQIGQLATALSNRPHAPGGEEATTPTTTDPSGVKENRMLQSKIPQKMKDPGSFTIPCSIGTKYSGKALCDLGASINLMPLSVFKKLGVGEYRPTTVTLQLADRSHAYLERKIEDVLVKVDKFIFLVDFIVLDFKADKEVPIILGRPFLATGKTLIDVQKGELTMRVNDQQVTFNVLDSMKSPDEIEDCNFISVMDFVVVEKLHSCCSKEEINAVTFEELDDEDHRAVNIAWSGEKQPLRIDEQIQQRELTPDQQEFKVNGPRVKHYMRDDVNNLKTDMFLNDPG
ncbi:hypothetical protein KPL70_023512 [Citrus sinensis]|nr:hypothetical protein KPL70_023512 [Citrus sinensis]